MNDATQPVTYRPPIKRVIRGLLSDYGRPFGVSDDLLVAMTHAETDADAGTVRRTIARLEQRGEIYNASGDATAPRWKVTRA